MTRKDSENDLSIHEIINAYDKIITDFPDKLDPLNRSKIYLQLISFRQQYEAEQIEKLNRNVESL